MQQELTPHQAACSGKCTEKENAERCLCSLCKEETHRSYWKDQAGHLYAAERLLYLFYYRQEEGVVSS